MSDFSTPVSFRFSITLPGADAEAFDVQEILGLDAPGPGTESLSEGGENAFVHRLPKAVKRPNLVLKRGVVAANGSLVRWCRDTLEGDFGTPIEPRSLSITLKDEAAAVISAWQVQSAYPVKWSIGAFDAMKNELTVETVELAYSGINRQT